jgi:NAD(P)H-flavin reductase
MRSSTPVDSRFGIFFPVLISWGVYFIDKGREFVFHTYGVTMASRQSFNRSNRCVACRGWRVVSLCVLLARSGYPTAYRIHFEKPKALKVTAGQWMYLLVPAIDQVWHPFSICSSSGDDKLSFHIGIRTTGDPAEQWSATRTVGGRSWSLQPETWTYRLFKRLDVSHPYLKAYVRGPYGAAFTSCFNPLNAGVMVIGAGTGLTAAESVVREILFRKANGTPVPLRLWFVWSCRTVDDLFWCWQSMIELLLAAFDAQTIDAKAVVSSGASLDWLGVTIYVSRADKDAMALLKSLYPKPPPPPVAAPMDSGRMRGVTDAPTSDAGRMRSTTDTPQMDTPSSTYQAAKGVDAGGANIYGALKDVMAAYTKAPSRAAGADGKVNYSKMQEGGKQEAYQPMNQLWQTSEPLGQPANTMANALSTDSTIETSDEMIAARRAHVGYWLVNRIVEGSLDGERTHIEKHLRSM